MRLAPAALIAVLAVAPATVFAKPAFPPGAEALEARMLRHAGPQTRAFIAREAAHQHALFRPTEDTALAQVNGHSAALGAASHPDAEALLLLVLMQAARDEDSDIDDLRAALNGALRGAAVARAGDRDKIAALKAAEAQATADARAAYDKLSAEGKMGPALTVDAFLAACSIHFNSDTAADPHHPQPHRSGAVLRARNADAGGDQTELMQIRLQIYTDQRTQALEAISNVMKKFSATDQTLVHNMK